MSRVTIEKWLDLLGDYRQSMTAWARMTGNANAGKGLDYINSLDSDSPPSESLYLDTLSNYRVARSEWRSVSGDGMKDAVERSIAGADRHKL